jgi:hypothetical protein
MITHNLGRSYYEITASPEDWEAPVSKSLLWDFFKSPYRFVHSKAKVATPAMNFGSLVHCAMLTPELLGKEFIVSPFPDYRTKAAQEWKAESVKLGNVIVSQEDLDKASDISDVVHACVEFPIEYDTEVAVFGGIDGVPAKGMIDIVPKAGSTLYDLKTISKIESLYDLQRKILDYGYHWQAALYLDLWNAASGESRTEFVFIFVETSAPYETAFIRLSPEFIELGRHGYSFGGRKKHYGYMDAVEKWKRCVSESSFPKQISGIQTVYPPSWVSNEP